MYPPPPLLQTLHLLLLFRPSDTSLVITVKPQYVTVNKAETWIQVNEGDA